jgi:amino acid adenylation domain-containing protein/non-ribosomal peptide synthase protein (TIGR01720 family)
LPDSGPAAVAIAPDPQERLKRLLAAKGIRLGSSAGEPGPRPPGEPPRLSFAQERLWFLQRLDPSSHAYHLGQAFSIKGPIDEAALARAFDALLARHEGLRTAFPADADGRARAEIIPPGRGLLRTVDLETRSGADQAGAISAEEDRIYCEPFDLERPPLLRATLLRLGKDRHRLVLCVHHLVFDGWSIGIVARELSDLYAVETGVRSAALAPLSLSYADYAFWQRRRAEEPAWKQTLAWWEDRLRGLPPLELPADRNRPAQASGKGGGIRFEISAASADRLRALARREGATLFAVILAGYEAGLSRHSGQTDFGVGVSVAGRTHRTLEELAGMFVNTIVFRAALNGDPSFSSLVRRVQGEAVESLARPETPFEQIVDRLSASRDLGRNPLFQAGLFFQNAPAPRFRLGGAVLESVPGESRSAKFDLLLALEERAEGPLSCLLEYSSDRFSPETAGRIGARLRVLFDAAGREPDRRLSELEWMPAAESDEVCGWSLGPRRDFGPEIWIHEAPDRQDPGAAAVSDPTGRRLTYAQFTLEAERLARSLRGLGAGPEMLVAVCLDRSIELVLALHAVLRAGAAFVPLDPAYPPDRLGWIAENAGAPIIVTTRALQGRLPELPARRLFLDEPWPEGPASSERPRGGSAAYLIYTSGSTGRPKGAINTHEGIRNLVEWVRSAYPLGPGDRFLQKTPCSFDVSVREFFWPLACGAELVVAEPGAHRDPARIAEIVARHAITDLNFVPSVFRAFLDDPGSSRCPTLRRIYCTGEELPRDLVNRCRDRIGAELLNLYGPTEAAVEFTHQTCGPGEGPVPIGRPMSNLEVWILDSAMRPVPRGVVGELLLGGVNLARGYHGRPDLTAECWVPHPAGDGARLYRTGDLGRWRADGAIEFLGRTDFQVKLRGQRIELGEIEAVLRDHPSIRDAAVVVRDGRLVAYAVPRTGSIPVAEVQKWLGGRLPEYMVPPTWVEPAALPLNPAGKTDRKALPAPAAQSAEFVAPQGAREETLAACWREVLRVERVGRRDGYFDLGGDSILSLQLQARLRSRGWELKLADLFQHQSLAAMAEVLAPTGARAESRRDEPFALLAPEDRGRFSEGIEDAYPLTALQAGMVLHAELHPRSLVYREVFTFELRAPWAEEALRDALAAVMGRHAILRTSFDLRAGAEPLQRVHRDVSLPLAAEDLRTLDRPAQERALAEAMRRDLERGFDWAQPPLWRARADRRSDTTWQFTLAAHHAILDGWSAAALLAEVLSVYLNRREGRPAGEAVRPPAFRRYVELEREAAANTESRHFWADLLADSTAGRLPRRSGHPGPEGRDQASARRRWQGAELAGLRDLAARAGAGLKHVLLAAHLKAAQVHTGQTDVVTGVISGGRPEEADAEATLGLFLNTIPMRHRLGRESWIDLIRAVVAAEQAAWPHRRFPLAEMQKGRSRAAVFDTTFNYVHYRGLDAVRSRADVALLGAAFHDENSFSSFAQFSLDTLRDELELDLRYSTEEIAAETAEEYASSHAAALASMLAAPDSPHAAAALLAPATRDRELRRDNERELPAGPGGLLHSGFRAQAIRNPAAIAVIDGDRRISYGELSGRVQAWAARLRDLGAGPERLVAVCLERGADLLTALLAVLEAGAAYVPLDPAYPAERLAFLCEDARADLLISRPALAAKLPATGARLVDVEELAGSKAGLPGSAPPATAQAWTAGPDNLAYLIYTSGSTGRPKAAAIAHRNASALVAWALEEHSAAELAGTLASTSVCFDLSVFELFVPLAAGGTVILAENALALPALPARGQVTLINTVPSAAAELARQGAIPRGVRAVNLAGEPFSAALAERLHGLGTLETIRDLYGPSEDTTYSTGTRREPGAPETIGRVLPGSSLYLLDEYGQPVPPGVAGEIFLGGAGIARGYWGRPDLTAERFGPDPFGPPGGRLYRTGDRARRLSDGRLAFLGRTDHQVKLRGFRIELGEIQAALERREGVSEAAVMLKDGPGGRPRLVAYVAGPSLPLADEWRTWLGARLPEALVPSAFVALPRLPRTPNGKLDRAALPAPEAGEAASGREKTAPSTPAERLLARIWSEVLGVPEVGADDNFFDLGGDSILALQVASRAQAAGLGVTARRLFEAQTIRTLAAVAAAAAAGARSAAFDEGALTPIQHWFFAQDFAEAKHWNQTVLLRAKRPVEASALRSAFAALERRHPAFGRVYGRSAESLWQGRPGSGLGLAFETRDLPADAAALTAQCAAVQRTLDWENGPIARAVWFAGGPADPGRLLLSVHHLAVDGVSWRILLDDLASAHRAAEQGREPSWASPAVDPAAWATWLKSGEANERQAEAPFWQDLAATSERPLPRDFSGRENAAASVRTVPVALDREETDALLRRTLPALGCRIDDALLTALALALRDWTARESHRIWREGHGRDAGASGLDLSRAVGWFTTLYPVRLDLEGAVGAGRALGAIRRQLAAVPARGSGYGAGRWLEQPPLWPEIPAELCFNYLGQFDAVVGEGSDFAPAPESPGPQMGARNRRPHAIDVNGLIAEGTLRFEWHYPPSMFREETVRRIAERQLTHLRALISAGAEPREDELARAAAEIELV